ncbi:MAG: pectate lyase [Marinilabiliaceae bacterium]|nr:pectate lyase [Marinilabiliaceae bacterium]
MKIIITLTTILISVISYSQHTNELPISLDEFSDGIHHWYLIDQENNYKRYAPENYIAIANNFVSFQNKDGGWPKNIDWLAIVDTDSLKATLSVRYQQSTFDNRNTFPQIRYLANAYLLTKNHTYKKSVEKGIKYILKNQNKSGGWRGWDVDAITFNDEVMTGIMELLLDIKQEKEYLNWLNKKLKTKTNKTLEKAITTTLKCQVVVNGNKTAWGQQHDHKTFKSVKARTFELEGLTANESVSVISLLMKIQNPDKDIIDAIKSGVNWLQKSAIHNLRVEEFEVPKGTYPGLTLSIDRKTIIDSTATPIWARFYEIETNKPFMCTREGQKVYSLEEVNPERRAGYAWYGYWPEILLKTDYPKWVENNVK